MFSAAFAMILASSATAAVPVASPESASKMSSSQIRDHNSGLDPMHPNYIRCVKSAETGSLVRKRSMCRTNQDWAAADEAGNREGRDIAEAMRSKASTGQ